MDDATLKSCREFVSLLASDAPAPGAGGPRPWWARSALHWATW